jgi:hypothetical protein
MTNGKQPMAKQQARNIFFQNLFLNNLIDMAKFILQEEIFLFS